MSSFVPYNAFEVPHLEPVQWEKVKAKFKRLVQTVNTTPYAEAYESKKMIDVVQRTLAKSTGGQGGFHILSVGNTTPFSLEDVVVQDVESLAVFRLSRVDMIVDTLHPLVVKQLILTPDTEFISSRLAAPRDELEPHYFRLLNPLHLFEPYRTSHNEMLRTKADRQLFSQEIMEKAKSMQELIDKEGEAEAGLFQTSPK